MSSAFRRSAGLHALLVAACLVAACLGVAGCGGETADPGPAPGAGDPPELVVVVERPVDPPRPEGSQEPLVMPPVVRLGVGDVAASAAFYRDLLGFTSVPDEALRDGEPAAGVRLARGELRVELVPGRGTAAAAGAAPSAGQPVLLVEVADAAGLFDRVGDRAELVRALTDGANGRREFAIADPDGHLLVFTQPL